MQIRSAVVGKPLVIDLFCGLGGWADGFLAEGYDCVGFDIERHQYGDDKYPAQLVLQDVAQLHGKQFRNAAVIVASPPCQEYSWMAMPWSLAKKKAAWYREVYTRQLELTFLFNNCFRIASEAGIPLVVENVKGAQPWVGQARAHFGSFYFWGDINTVGNAIVGPHPKFGEVLRAKRHVKCGSNEALKVPGLNWSGHGEPGYKPKGFNVTAAQRFREENGAKVPVYSDPRRNGGKGARLTSPGENERRLEEGTKQMSGLRGLSDPSGTGGRDLGGPNDPRRFSSSSDSRKAASAQIAKIPFPLAQYIARIFKP